jgi:hypothetical protein
MLDEVMLKFLDKTGSTAAALAVGRRGEILYSRGYGWSDQEKRVAMQPNTMIGIASCDKPITAAAIRRLARAGRLSLDAPLFEFLRIRPQGRVVDDRMKRISIRHLLEHKAGWGADPVPEAIEAARRSGFADPVPVELRPWTPEAGARSAAEAPIPMPPTNAEAMSPVYNGAISRPVSGRGLVRRSKPKWLSRMSTAAVGPAVGGVRVRAEGARNERPRRGGVVELEGCRLERRVAVGRVRICTPAAPLRYDE